jgi:WD40 repeat protein
MADVFISYPREEEPRVRQLVAALERRGRQVWVDWGSIPPSAEWQAEILSGIEGADVFVAFLTREYKQSSACGEELAHAVRHSKRMVPVAAEMLEGSDVPPELARINWLWWNSADDIESVCDRVIRTIDIDIDWVRAHTRLLVRAREWENGGQDNSLLLRGRDLTVMESWLAGKHVDPTTTPEQIQYIVHSRSGANRRQRVIAGAISLALLITAVLALTAEVLRRRANEQADIALTRQLAAQSTLVRERNVDQLPYATLLAAEAVKRSIARGVRVQEPEQAVRAALDVLPGQRVMVAAAAGSSLAGDSGSFLVIDGEGIPRLHHLDETAAAQELPHDGEKIEQSAFSGDGGLLVTATAGGTLRLWGARPLRPLATHKIDGSLRALTVSWDAFAAAVDDKVIVWEAPSGHEIAVLQMSGVVDALALFHERNQLVVASAEPAGKVSIKSVKTGELMATLDVSDTVRAIVVSNDQKTLIVEQQQQHTVVYEPEEGTTQIPTADGRTFKVWKVDGWREVAIQADVEPPTLGRHVSLAAGAVDRQSKWLAGGSVYRGTQVWDLETGRRLIWLDEVDFVSALRFSNDGRWLVTGTKNGTVSIWEIGSERRDGAFAASRVSTFKTDGPIQSVSIDQDGRHIVVRGSTMVGVWRIGQEAAAVAEDDVRTVAFTEPGRLSILSGRTRLLVDANSGNVLQREKAGATETPRRKETRSPDGRWLVIDDSDDKVAIQEAATGRVVVEPFQYYDDYLIQFSPNGEFVATNDGTKRFQVWTLPDGRPVAQLEHPGYEISRIQFAASGAWLITTARMSDERREYTTRLWRTDAWAQAGFIDDTATAVLLSADERLVAAGYKDGRMALFDSGTGALRVTSIVHDRPVTQLLFSANGQLLAAAADDRVQVIETRAGSDIARLRIRDGVRSMVFSEDGRWIASSSFRGVQVWRLRPDDLLAEACARLERNLTDAEWQAAFGQVAAQPTCQK